jgi:hypothetical protein
MTNRPVESGWVGDAVVCADSVGSDRGGSGEAAQHDSIRRPGLIFSRLLCRNRLCSAVTPIEAALAVKFRHLGAERCVHSVGQPWD